MAPPSQLAIMTLSVLRLVKEEASYYKELQQQEARIQKLEPGDENAEFILKQEKRGIEETKAVFPELRTRINAALEKLEELLADDSGSSPEEVEKARDAVAKATASLSEIA